MTKVIFLGDLHLGIKQDAPIIYQAYEKFFDQVLFPYIREHNIKHVIQFGDVLPKF
jgi:DNA repair exonuclease SbcCD nuclease subunit